MWVMELFEEAVVWLEDVMSHRDAPPGITEVVVAELRTLLDVLTSLVDKSLLRSLDTPDGTTRFAMLGTIREFALEQLKASRRA